ncbi:Golgi SNAP receptor complex member 1 [Leucoagaricus sp. SymC.cos]|nr:Golgi SNAP receptor complex member 1 [Leucoagaricus sp. SymC.cos]
MLRTIQRHREIFQDTSRELRRTKTNVHAALDKANLLSGVRNDIDAYKTSAADALLAERGRIDSSHQMTDEILACVESSHKFLMVLMVYSQAYETRSEFTRQRTTLSNVNTRMVGVLNKMPGINNLVAMIKSRRRRDSIILGVMIGVCTIIILSYIWN